MAGPFTTEKENYARMIVLINEKGTEAFQKTLDYHAPKTCKVATFNDALQNKKATVTQLRGKGKPLTTVQWNQLYPGRVVYATELDITLCFIILRQFNLCGLKAPVTGWDSEPTPGNTSTEASLAQLKYIRNVLAHLQKPELSTVDFTKFFQTTSDAINNISSKLPAGMFDVSNVIDYKTLPITPQVIQQSEDIFREWKGQDAHVVEMLDIQMKEMKKLQKDTVDKVERKIEEQNDAIAMKFIELEEERKRKAKEEAKEKEAQSCTLPNPELLSCLQCSLKTDYKSKYSEVSFIQGEVQPKTFDVDSDLYKPVQFMPVEVSCSQFSRQDKKTTTKNAEVSSQENHMSQEAENDSLENTKSTSQITSLLTSCNNPKIYPILVEAEAGVGKTTLLHHLALDWSKENCEVLKRFDLVFLIHLRRVKSIKVEDIICEDLNLLPPSHKMSLKSYLELCKDKVLYLIDGLDEVQMHEENELLKKMREPGNHVICTSRPVLQPEHKGSPHGMEKRLHVKLLGFSDGTIHDYIKTYFHMDIDGGQSKAEKILNECRKHMFCKAIMRTPLYTGLLCFLWEKLDCQLPDTATQLFNKFLKEKLIIFQQKRNKSQTFDIEFIKNPLVKTVSNEIRHILFHVAQLAFKTLVEGKVVFSFTDVHECYLKLEQITQLGFFTIEDPKGSIIQFSHKLFHEYFAGLWLVEYPREIENLFRTDREGILSRKHPLHHAFFFAAGLSSKAFNSIISASDHSYDNYRVMDRDTTYIEVFKVQLLFEHGVNDAGDLRLKLFTIPIHCSSAHSLAAAFTVMQSRNSNCDTITLIGGGHSDTEQIRCILNECQKAKQITSVIFYNSTVAVLKELGRIVWPSMKRIEFENCEVVINSKYLRTIFPNIKHVVYDGKERSVYKENGGLCEMSLETNLTPSKCCIKASTDEVDVEFQVGNGYFNPNILDVCKVHTIETEFCDKLLSLSPTLFQWIHTLIVSYIVSYSCKKVCLLCPNLKFLCVSIWHTENKDNVLPTGNVSKSVRLLLGDPMIINAKSIFHRQSERKNETITLIVGRVFVTEFLKGMSLSVVSTLGAEYSLSYFCDTNCMRRILVFKFKTPRKIQDQQQQDIQGETKSICGQQRYVTDQGRQNLKSNSSQKSSVVSPRKYGMKHDSNLVYHDAIRYRGQTCQSIPINTPQDSNQHLQSPVYPPVRPDHGFPFTTQEYQRSQNQGSHIMQASGDPVQYYTTFPPSQSVAPTHHLNQQQLPPSVQQSPGLQQPYQFVRPPVSLQRPSFNQRNHNFQAHGFQNYNLQADPNAHYQRIPYQHEPQVGFQQQKYLIQQNHATPILDSKHLSPQFNMPTGHPISINTNTRDTGTESLQSHNAPQHQSFAEIQQSDHSSGDSSRIIMGDNSTCQHKSKIKDFLESNSRFPQILLGPVLVSLDMCEYIVSILDKSPMYEYTWTLEGQCITELPDPDTASVDDYFMLGTQWLDWEQYQVKCHEVDIEYQSLKAQGKKFVGPYGVIRMTRKRR